MALRRGLLRLALGARKPIVSGELIAPGLQKPITIRRSTHGIPMIEAENRLDAAFGIGFCQGQDRCLQLELLLRIARGTLSEFVGPAGLPVDRLSRRIGFWRSAEAQLAAVDADVREALEHYSAGIAVGISRGLPKKPHEFSLVKGNPTPWTPTDTLAYLKLSSFSLPSNWDTEIARLRMIQADGIAAVEALDPSAELIQNSSSGIDLKPLLRDLGLFQEWVPRGGGSNNWCISGSRTTSGKPLLASDPHLPASIPAPWYLVQVRTPDWAAAGATFIGAPAIIIGHNGFCAWGVTSGQTDNTDLFIETLSSDGRSVRHADGSFTPCEMRTETIRVKGQADVTEEVLVTPRGPIITPLIAGVTDAVSMQAIWLNAEPVCGFFAAQHARSFPEFREAFRHWPSMPLNVAYADETGTIGWQLIGQLPIRQSGFGTTPQHADAPNIGWKNERVPFEQMPYVQNPSCGYYATANEHPLDRAQSDTTVSADLFLGADFLEPHRGNIIREELAKYETEWTVERCLALQMNLYCKPWESLRDNVLSLVAHHAEAREAVELLRAWNGHILADSAGAALYEVFIAEICERIAKQHAPKSWRVAIGGTDEGMMSGNLFNERRISHLVRYLKKQPSPQLIEDSLLTAMRRLRAELGPSPAWWSWGEYRPLHLKHILLGKSKLLGPVFNFARVPHGGDHYTVNQAGACLRDLRRPVTNLPNLRAVFDCGNWSNSRVILCSGQSGNPFSPHYADMFPLWQQGQTVPLPYTVEDVLQASKSTLRLLPGA